ncbi:MAG TPA: VCBS repeat-containing protein [candidate division WOR-3 bacterium]|uniref:VCBS repeat-containing protein n=1 Tax=candidate division WOR-3 bacterium TaxID=2052148 RepID=A0A7V0XEZ8_UNCW3|nr:VCBS repeat-containing protein [candidate division WOR-3 bacterium]
MLLAVIILLPGLLVPPGATVTVCRTSAFGVDHYDIEHGRALDDTSIILSDRWGVTVNTGFFTGGPEPGIAVRLSRPAYENPGLSVSKLVVLDHRLNILWQDSWGYSGNPEMSSITVADLDGDGRDEIIIPFAQTFFSQPPQYKGRILVLDGATGAVRPGWPFILPGWPEDPYHKVHSEVAAADLTGDGRLEIVVQVADLGSIRKPGAGLYVIDADGDSLWKHLFYEDSIHRHGSYTSPAVADIDGDGIPEILCHAGVFSDDHPYPVIEKRFFIINADGTVRRHWQTEGPGGGWSPDYSSPVVGDLDGDDVPEIVFARRGGWLDCYDTLGNMRPGFPVNLTTDAGYYPANPVSRAFATPALADLTGDGRLEIVVGTSGREACNTRWAGRVHAFDADGNALPGFPGTTRNAIWYSPAIGNADADPGLEILTAGCDSSFYLVDAAGNHLPGSPRTGFPTYWLPDRGSYAFIEGIIPMSRTPFLTDLSGNGLVDILMSGADGSFHAWPTDAPHIAGRFPSPTFRFDRARTGWYRPPTTGTASPRPVAPARPGILGPTIRRPGPIRLALPAPADAARAIAARDAAGRTLRTRPVSADERDGRVIEFDLTGLPAGVIFLHIEGQAGAARLVLVD